jgi:nucleoside-diphosphate-sugar epimerase
LTPAPVAPAEDIQFILAKLRELVPNLQFQGESVLLTGGTGFFGKWLTQALLAMNDAWNLNNHLTLVTRDKDRAMASLPWLISRQDVSFIESDIRSLQSKRAFTTIIHAAAAASQDLNQNRPEEMFDTILDGTRQVLKIAELGPCRRLQFISSGGVYGAQPSNIEKVSEDYVGAPNTLDPKASYGEGKRAAELLSAIAARKHGFKLSIPRCFAFVGPYLPMDIHFAAGNFLKSVIDQQPILIGGDGTPYRSYLYSADLTVWLLVMLLRDSPSVVYNVGSEESLSIREVAETMNAAGYMAYPSRKEMKDPVRIARAADPSAKASRYVPSAKRAEEELNLRAWTNLHTATLKTLNWYKEQKA